VLIVRRRTGQSIVIAGELEIEILEIAANRVKLGIVGPRAVSVARKEVGLTIENNQAARTIGTHERELIVRKIARLPQMDRQTADMCFEQDTSGIHENGEPEPGRMLGCI
jgi:carbon storage regulator